MTLCDRLTAWAAVPDAAAATRRVVRRSLRRKAAPATPISIDDLAMSATEIAEPNEPEPRRNALAHAANAEGDFLIYSPSSSTYSTGGVPSRVTGGGGDRNGDMSRASWARRTTVKSRIVTKERLTTILATIDNIVWSIAADTYETLYLNPAAERIYGRTASAFYADPQLFMSIVHPEDRPRVAQMLPN